MKYEISSYRFLDYQCIIIHKKYELYAAERLTKILNKMAYGIFPSVYKIKRYHEPSSGKLIFGVRGH